MVRPLGWVVVLLGAGLLGGCAGCRPDTTPDAGVVVVPADIVSCPGAPGCASGKGILKAGAARASITPRGFEIANVAYLRGRECDPIMLQRFGMAQCGELPDEYIRDCGKDGLCPGATGYTAPDADGTEANGQQDWFFDCGRDRLCPTNVPEADQTNGVDDDGDGAVDDGAYTAPDADGSEGDGYFQAAWLAGYGNNRPAMGVRDDVEARCLALEAGDTTVVVCSIDVVGFFHDEVDKARALYAMRHPDQPVDYLAIISTHTHESVDTMGQWGRADPVPITPGRMEGHNAYIVDQVVAAAAQAVTQLQPATLRAAATQTGPNLLRDGTDPQIADDTLTVLEAVAVSGGAPIFTAVHWGNHPEAMGDDNSLLSSDYAHDLRAAVEQGLPAQGTHPAHAGRGGLAIYLNGTVGGIMSPDLDFTARDGTVVPRRPRVFSRIKAYGEALAEHAFEALDSPTDITGEVDVAVRAQSTRLKIDNKVFLFAFASGLFERRIFNDVNGLELDGALTDFSETPIAVASEVFSITVGPVSLLGMPGEVFPELVVGGYDGSRSLGRVLVDPAFCPPQESCRADNNAVCPTQRPPDGWLDCDCEACRLCTPPDLTAAPAGPYLKDNIPGTFKLVLGLANDELGYLVPPYYFRVSEANPYFCEAHNHYEETNGLGPLTVPRLLDALGHVLP